MQWFFFYNLKLILSVLFNCAKFIHRAFGAIFISAVFFFFTGIIKTFHISVVVVVVAVVVVGGVVVPELRSQTNEKKRRKNKKYNFQQKVLSVFSIL